MQNEIINDHEIEPRPEGAIARLGTVRWRHADCCRMLAFVGNGQSLVTGGDDGLVAEWSVPDGRRLRTFGKQPVAIHGVEVSPDGRFLAVGTSLKNVLVWEVATARQLWATKRCFWIDNCGLAFSPDSRRLAIVDTLHYCVHIYDAESGAEVTSFSDEGKVIQPLCWSPDGLRIAYGSTDGTISVCEFWSGVSQVLGKHEDEIRGLAFSPDGSMLASVSGVPTIFRDRQNRLDPTLRLWDVKSSKQLDVIRASKEAELIGFVAFSRDGKFVAISDQRDARVFQVSSDGNLKEHQVLRGHSSVEKLRFSPNGKYLAGGSTGRSLCLWDLVSQSELLQLSGHTDLIVSEAFSRDGRALTSISLDESMITWDLAGSKLRHSTAKAGGEKPRFISPSGKYIIFNRPSPNFDFRVIDVEASKQQEAFPFTSFCFRFAIDERERRIAVASEEGVALCDLVSRRRLWTVKLAAQSHCVRFTRDHSQVLTWSYYSSDIQLLEARTGKLMGTLNTEGQIPISGDVSTDGRQFALALSNEGHSSNGRRNHIAIYDLSSHKRECQLLLENKAATRTLFCRRDQYLLSGYADGTVCFWDLSTKRCLKTFQCDSQITSILVHPLQDQFAAVCTDTTILIWPLPPT